MMLSGVVLILASCGCMWSLTSAQTMMNNRSMQEAYLKRFSHLGAMNPDPRMAALQSDPEEQFRMAVRSFQRFAGLEMTGNVDTETVKMMESPRCGVADLQNNMGGVARRRRRRYTATGDKWPRAAITYRHTTSSTSDLSLDVVKNEMAKAFKYWSDVSPLTFTETPNRASDIEISFGTGNHGDNAPFDNQGGTLAHAYFPGLGIGGDVHFDDAETFTSGTASGTNFLQVATHELGHSLGLGHSENQNAIMAPFYRGYKPNLVLDADDIAGIQYLYGRRISPSPAPGVTTTTTPPYPTIDTGSSVSAFCRNPVIDAIDVVNGSIHAFYGDNYIQLDENGHIRPGFPKLIGETFKGLPNSLDAVLSLETATGGTVYFFKETNVYTFSKAKPNEIRGPFPINDLFQLSGRLTTVDAAFVWSGNGQIYFIKGDKIYWVRLLNGRGYVQQPRNLTSWSGLPKQIDDAFRHITGRTYFFSGKKLYNFHDKDFKVQFVEDTYDWMHCCGVRVKELEAMHFTNTAPVSKSSFMRNVAAAALALYYIRQTTK